MKKGYVYKNKTDANPDCWYVLAWAYDKKTVMAQAARWNSLPETVEGIVERERDGMVVDHYVRPDDGAPYGVQMAVIARDGGIRYELYGEYPRLGDARSVADNAPWQCRVVDRKCGEVYTTVH